MKVFIERENTIEYVYRILCGRCAMTYIRTNESKKYLQQIF